MDVMNVEQAKLAEELAEAAGAVAVMALERIQPTSALTEASPACPTRP